MSKSNQWVKDALKGKYQFHGGGKNKSMRPGHGKKGAATEKAVNMLSKRSKLPAPTHGEEAMEPTKGSC